MLLDLESKLQNIRLLVMDVDGTLTDGTIVIHSNGVETKHFNVKDGMGIVMAERAGIRTAILSSRQSSVVLNRARELGVSVVKQGVKDKVKALHEILDELNISAEETAFVGDDINDSEVCKIVGVGFAVNDAADALKSVAHMVLKNPGGKGAVREAIDLILSSKMNS